MIRLIVLYRIPRKDIRTLVPLPFTVSQYPVLQPGDCTEFLLLFDLCRSLSAINGLAVLKCKGCLSFIAVLPKPLFPCSQGIDETSLTELL